MYNTQHVEVYAPRTVRLTWLLIYLCHNPCCRPVSELDKDLQHWLQGTQNAFDDMLAQLFNIHDLRGKVHH